MKKIMLVFGTRPEAIKMAPLVKEIQKNKKLSAVIVVTGQHKQMLKQVLDIFDIVPDYDLAIMKPNQTLNDVTESVLHHIRRVLLDEKPDIVLVHGDTTTAFATSLAAFYLQIRVGHVEAGLRTYNLKAPFPEEFNRQAVDIIADYMFAPTETSRQNLIKEGKDANKIFVTGNTVIDAMATTIKKNFIHSELSWASDSRLILLTAHRRENLGEPIRNIFRAVKRIVEEYQNVKVIYPVHLNPAVKQAAEEILGDNPKIRLIEPLDVETFHNFINASYIVLTDSGGIQEEAPALGKPVLVARETTERPEGVAAGTLRLVGTDGDFIYGNIKTLLDSRSEYDIMSKANNPYGDGTASRQIVNIIQAKGI
jgi:UDP-N-acetylglucosamine 2-epimerase (non-hydrolysing)